MNTPVALASANPDLLVGLAEVRGVRVAPAPDALVHAIEDLCARRRGTDFPPADFRKAVRDLLRHGGFKPTGRNKPASEYLARAADADAFPRISGVVDALNAFSLETGWPISLLDLDLALAGGTGLEVREGHPGESYVFNAGGQEIDVTGLVVAARVGGAAIGNPVKDSLETKTTVATRNVLALLYATRQRATGAEVLDLARRLADSIRIHGGGDEASASVLGA